MKVRFRARMCAACCAPLGLLAALLSGAQAGPRPCAGVDYNAMILDIIGSLPSGGGYSLASARVQLPTVTAHNIGAGRWEMRVYDGHPSYCTSATYAVYARLVAMLHNSGSIDLSADQLRALQIHRTMPDGSTRVDGQGVYAIFNANGAGVAALLKHTGTGMSFRDDELSYARPGDFVKLFWNGNVGASEQGHQAIFTGQRTQAGRDMICFWASQKQNRKKRPGRGTEALYFPAAAGGKVKDGYGEVCRPRSDVKAMIFSRITCMEHLPAGLAEMQRRGEAVGTYVFVDEYMHSLRKQSSDHATLDRMYGILPAPEALTSLATATPSR